MNIPCDTCVYQPYCSEQRGQCTEYKNKYHIREEVLNAGSQYRSSAGNADTNTLGQVREGGDS